MKLELEQFYVKTAAFDLTCTCLSAAPVLPNDHSRGLLLPTYSKTMKSKLTCFIEEEGILILLHVLGGSSLVQEQRINTFNILHLHLCPLKKTKHTGEVNTEVKGDDVMMADLRYSCRPDMIVQTELTLRLRHTSPAVLISWMA